MNKYINIILVFLIVIICADTLDAQRRRRSRDQQKTSEANKSIADKINYEIRFGNIAFGGGFALDLKPSVGFKFNEIFTAGGGFRLDYDFINQPFEDISLLSTGPFVLARAKFLSNFYAQGEYTIFSFDTLNGTKLKRNFPSAGLGYVQGGENWKFNLEGLVILDETTRNLFNNTVEFWFVFSKNF